jgi:4-hydroxy-tetrahydrodipicolinate synthase
MIDGTIPPIATPVTARTGEVRIATERLREYVEWLETGGVHGVFPCGSTGEFTSLTPDQRKRVVEVTAEAAEGPVLAGCGGTSVDGVRNRIAHAADAGADVAVVVAPYYMPSTQDGLSDFYTAVAEESPLPIMIYDIPELSGQELALDTVLDLATHERITGIKDTTRDFVRLRRILDRTADDFRVLQADTVAAVPALDNGADGLVPTSANLIPGVLSTVVEAHRSGDRDRASELMRDAVLPVIELFAGEDTLSAVKTLVGAAGGPELGPPLPPLPSISDNRQAELRDEFDALDLPDVGGE